MKKKKWRKLKKKRKMEMKAFLKMYNPYKPLKTFPINLRAYSRYLREHNIPPEEATEEIVNMFRRDKQKEESQ